jgi:acetyl-CoA carboxylase biotin carboxyl carrier protein
VSLTAADVAEIMRLVEQSSFDELTLEVEGMKLCLRRGGAVSAAPADQPSTDNRANGATRSPGIAASSALARSPAADAAAPNAAANALTSSARNAPATAAGGTSANASGHSAIPTGAAALDPNVQDVVAPLLGTFYRAPKPGAAPFVEVGSVVEEDTVIAIIEVMKLMNSVRAGVRGTVTEVLVSDGSLVEYEQVLLRVRKAG